KLAMAAFYPYPKPEILIPRMSGADISATHFSSWDQKLEMWMQAFMGQDNRILVGGEKTNAFELVLNTVLGIGNEPIRLCAYLHGMCEIHTFVEVEDAGWLAGVIEEGLKQKIFR